MDEFEIMRQQLAAVKLRLDTQQIINKDLMHRVMRGKASWLNIFVTAELIAMPFIYLLFVIICDIFDISQWYSFTFLICGGIDALLDIRTVRIPAKLFSSSSILSLKKFLVRQKKERFIQTCISGACCVIWLILFILAMSVSSSSVGHSPDSGFREALLTGGLAGAIIGVVAGIVIIVILYRKMQRTNDQILADINQLESEE